MSRRWVMLGMPNTGKSTLFNRLSGSKSRVGNWPGLTIDIHTARILVGGHMVHLADLPGIHDLNGHSEDERIVCSHLNQEGVEGILFVTNATQLARQLPLVHQVQSLGIPMALVINMMDEATKLGVTVDATALSQRMGIPVVPISARLNQGLPALDQVLRDLADHPTPPPVTTMVCTRPNGIMRKATCPAISALDPSGGSHPVASSFGSAHLLCAALVDVSTGFFHRQAHSGWLGLAESGHSSTCP